MNVRAVKYGDPILEDLWYESYGEYLMNNTDLPVGNGDMLLAVMEKYLYWNEFLLSVGIVEV
jgi:hypothetical protein